MAIPDSRLVCARDKPRCSKTRSPQRKPQLAAPCSVLRSQRIGPGKAKSYIANNLGAWLKLLSIKLCNFWNAFQYDDLSIITNLREQGVVLPGIYFGIVAALGLPGMLLAWRFAPQSRWVTAAVFLHMFSLLAVFITERYRLAVVPGLLLFAVFGLSILWESCVLGDYRRIAVYAAPLLSDR